MISPESGSGKEDYNMIKQNWKTIAFTALASSIDTIQVYLMSNLVNWKPLNHI